MSLALRTPAASRAPSEKRRDKGTRNWFDYPAIRRGDRGNVESGARLSDVKHEDLRVLR